MYKFDTLLISCIAGDSSLKSKYNKSKYKYDMSLWHQIDQQKWTINIREWDINYKILYKYNIYWWIHDHAISYSLIKSLQLHGCWKYGTINILLYLGSNSNLTGGNTCYK